jgi:HTH-type transcriptional regulator / antitoxin HipB
MRPIGRISQDSGQTPADATDRSHLIYLRPMERANSPLELGAAIRERRRRLGITQDALASSIGVNRKVVGQLEQGKETVHVGIVLRAARAVGLNVGVEARG